MKYVYPYRRNDGYRSILEAVNMEDARNHLLSVCKGITFCQIEIPEDFPFLQWERDLDDIIDGYLENNKTFTT